MHAPHIRKDTGLFYVTVNLCLSFVSGVPPTSFSNRYTRSSQSPSLDPNITYRSVLSVLSNALNRLTAPQYLGCP